MPNEASGHDPLNGLPVYVRLYRVPKLGEGDCHVRFLSNYDGMLTHWARGKSEACAGDKRCLPGMHRTERFWKGYAAAQLWVPAPTSAYAPIVFEVTERLSDYLPSTDLRGQVWRFWREAVGTGKPEVQGQFLKCDTLDNLAIQHDFRSTVCRIYHTTDMVWGCKPIMPARVVLDMVSGQSPVEKVTQPQPVPATMAPADMKAKWAEERAKQGFPMKG